MPNGCLTLRGWKGFDGPIRLWPVTFLVGPNGSGKSSLLEALALVSHLARRGTLREDLRPWLRGWPDGIFGPTRDRAAKERVALRIDWGRSVYELDLEAGAHPAISRERLEVNGREYIKTVARGNRRYRTFTGEGVGRGIEVNDPAESALALISRSPKRRKKAQRVIDLMSKMEIYSLDADFLRGTAVDPRPLPYARKGTGLVSGLIDAKRSPASFDAVLNALRAVQPDLVDVEVETKPRGAILKYAGGRETQWDEESDGLVRAAGMFLVRYRRDCPAILGFDEPENGFHLSRLLDVVSRLAPSASKGLPSPQLVLLATHSPEMVRKAAAALRGSMGAISLWRSKDGRVVVREWPGEELDGQLRFDELRAEAFEGR